MKKLSITFSYETLIFQPNVRKAAMPLNITDGLMGMTNNSIQVSRILPQNFQRNNFQCPLVRASQKYSGRHLVLIRF